MPDLFVLACAGQSTRWNGHLGVRHKPLIEVDGETLLARTVRLIKDRLPRASVMIVAESPELEMEESWLVAPHRCSRPCDVDRFTSSRPHWLRDRCTTILFGDVYFTEEAIDKILAMMDTSIRWYGRPLASKVTGKAYGELFGVSLLPNMLGDFAAHCEAARANHYSPKKSRAIGWDVFRMLHGEPLGGCSRVRVPELTVIDDATEDFDFPIDYDRWVVWTSQQR